VFGPTRFSALCFDRIRCWCLGCDDWPLHPSPACAMCSIEIPSARFKAQTHLPYLFFLYLADHTFPDGRRAWRRRRRWR